MTRRAGTLAAACAALTLAAPAAASSWEEGDVFVGAASSYAVFDSSGAPKETLPALPGASAAGCALSPSGPLEQLGDLWTVQPASPSGSRPNRIVRYSREHPHAVVQTIETDGDGIEQLIDQSAPRALHPVSISFDASGSFYVGNGLGTAAVQRYATTGAAPPVSYAVPGRQGGYVVDLAADQRTLYYGSRDREVRRHDVTGPAALRPELGRLPSVATLPLGHEVYTVRVLPGGRTLVAGTRDVRLLGPQGETVRVYDLPGRDRWLTLALATDRATFWAGNDAPPGEVVRFDIESGAQVGPVLQAGTTDLGQLNGVCVKGEPRAATLGALVQR